ncbi:hypothetical protein [Janthinobacterium psychrotolerans]|uniref:Uncharacterized protein n=1 Tax=Janthinobacterium psychrotolerans TaxID=1747903 RepID=A0A1A7BTM3_9BURK|nr:hypothetical protein [Janthinobacterium psychrotolerans]OBV36852.1 hypothetical protein ASR47_1001329 [Janthinobacterium psychrotolerans]
MANFYHLILSKETSHGAQNTGDLHGPALSHFSNLFRCQKELLAITPAIWKTRTELFGKTRSNTLQGLDRELKKYHARAAISGLVTVDAVEDLAVHAVLMYYALNSWKSDRSERDQVGGWKASKRNASHIFETLDDILTRSMRLTSAYSSASIPASEAQWFEEQQTSYSTQFCDMFKGARMIAKGSFVRASVGELAGMVAEQTGLQKTIDDGLAISAEATLGVAQRGAAAAGGLAVSAGRSMDKAALAVSKSKEAQFMRLVARAVGAKLGNPGGNEMANAIKQAIKGLGIAEEFMKNCMETVARTVGKAAYELISVIPGVNLLSTAADAGAAFYKALKAHLAGNEAKRNRYAVRTGATGDAYGAIVNLWDEERNASLKEAGTALATALVKGVCAAAGPIGAAITVGLEIAKKVYDACSKVWDFVTKILNAVDQMTTINVELAKLTPQSNTNAKALFDVSPLLATYYFLSLETSAMVALECKLLTMNGFMSVVERLKAQIDPVIDKAAEFLGAGGFMFVTSTGAPFPVRAKLNNPSLEEEIKALAKEKVAGFKDSVVEAAQAPYVESLSALAGIPSDS